VSSKIHKIYERDSYKINSVTHATIHVGIDSTENFFFKLILDNLYPDSRRLKLSTKWETSQSQVDEGYPSDTYRSNKYFPEAFPLKNVLTSSRQGLIQFFYLKPDFLLVT
jgi:hypothetical protein